MLDWKPQVTLEKASERRWTGIAGTSKPQIASPHALASGMKRWEPLGVETTRGRGAFKLRQGYRRYSAFVVLTTRYGGPAAQSATTSSLVGTGNPTESTAGT